MRKHCPIFVAASLAGNHTDTTVVTTSCLGEDCEFFIEKSDRCAIPVLLYVLAGYLTELHGDKEPEDLEDLTDD